MMYKVPAKFLGIAAAAASVSLIAAAPAQPQGEGEWDYLGSSGITLQGSYYFSKQFESSGGNVKVCVSTREQGAKLYGLFEYDPGSSANDQQIGTNRKQVAGGCETWDVSGYVDGSNKKAEVYLSTDDSKAHTAKFWD